MQSNLIPITSTAQARELGRKGGSVSSLRKKNAAKKREIRKRIQRGDIRSEDLVWIKLQLADPKAMAFDMLWTLDIAEDYALNCKEMIHLVNAKIELCKLVHGKGPYNRRYQEVVDIKEIIKQCAWHEDRS